MIMISQLRGKVSSFYKSMNANARVALGFFLLSLPSLVMEFCPHNFSVLQFLPTLFGMGVILRLSSILQHHHDPQQQQQQHQLSLDHSWLPRLQGVVIAASVMVLIHMVGIVAALWAANRDCALPTEERLGAETYVSSVLHSDSECALDFMICVAAAFVGSLFAAAAWYTHKWRSELVLLALAASNNNSNLAAKNIVAGANDQDDATVEFDYVRAVKTTEHSEGDYY